MTNVNDNSFAQLVASTARTQRVIDSSGAYQYFPKVPPAPAYYDNKIFDKQGNQIEVNANDPVSPYSYKYLIDLDEKPVDWEGVKGIKSSLRATKGLYMIKYVPPGNKDYKRGRPYKIGQDLVRWDIRLSGKKAWHELCKRVPEFRWIDRNSFFNEELFDIAKMHAGMTFWFSIDWIGYEKKIKKKAEPESVYVSRKCSVEDYKKIKSNKTLLIRYYNDVLKDINEVEKLSSVQEEMRVESGEGYDRSRKLARDPATGRFKKKEG